MPIVDVDDEDVEQKRATAVKQAKSRSKDFTGDFDNELVADLFAAILTLLVDIDADLVLCIMWFNSQTIRVPFASITGTTGTTSYLTTGARGRGTTRADTAVQAGFDDPRFGSQVALGMSWLR
jgi:hypothetical protein